MPFIYGTEYYGKYASCTLFWDCLIEDDYNLEGLLTDGNVSHDYSVFFTHILQRLKDVTYIEFPKQFRKKQDNNMSVV